MSGGSLIAQKDVPVLLPEWHPPQAIWLRWPYRSDIFAFQGRAAQADLKALIEVLLKTDLRIELMVPNAELKQAQHFLQPLKSEQLNFHTLSYGDVWLRDCAPFVSSHGVHQHFLFDSWGGIDDQWPLDLMARDWLSRFYRARTAKNTFILEGGAVTTDGQGTAIISAGSMLTRVAATAQSQGKQVQQAPLKAALEQVLLSQLGIQKVIWIPGCLYADETGGHIDNMLCFLAPGKLAYSQPEDKTHPDYLLCQQIAQTLSQLQDAQGRSFELIPIPLPMPPTLSVAEADSLAVKPGILERPVGMPLMASYLNFIRAGHWIIFPQFGLPEDAPALNCIRQAMPTCQVLTVPVRGLIVGGGGWHCASWVAPDWKINGVSN